MNDNNNIQLSEEQKEQLYREFKQRARIEDEAYEREFEIPEEILEDLDNTSKTDFHQRFKKYQRSLPKYQKTQWTSAETINKCFHADLKRENLDSYQVISSHYKHSDKLRTAGAAATEIFEELQSLIGTEDSIFANVLEKARRLAIFTYANAKFIDQEAKEIATKALHLPASVRHLGEEEETDKTLAFSPEIVEQVHKARFEQSLLRGNARGTNNYNRGGFNSRGGNFNFRGQSREATPPSSNRTPTPNNDRPRNHLNNNEQEGSSPIFYGKIPGISEPPLRNTGRWDITRGSTPIIQPVLEIPYQPPLAIGGNSRGIQNSVEFYPTIMEISPHETQVIGRPIGSRPSSDKILSSRDNREITFSEQRISVKLLHNPGGNQKKTYPRLQTIEQICTMPPFQDGRNTSIEISIGEGRFDMQNRLERRICSCSTTPPIQTFSYLPTPRYEPLRQEGIRLVYYLDDICLLSKTKEELHITVKKSIHTIPDTGILGVPIQYQKNENHSSNTKNKQAIAENSSSLTTNPTFLPLDSGSAGQDYLNDTGNRRSTSSHSSSSKGSSKESLLEQPKLGKTVSYILPESTGISMVEGVRFIQERPTYSSENSSITSDNDLHRQLRHGVGSELTNDDNIRVLDPSRQINKIAR
ncbi:hypothetical protein G6F68_009288 [Rhizopus microsporus]|nr:hypothetical protein G6F68_009288 [Rhizopus microsporus]